MFQKKPYNKTRRRVFITFCLCVVIFALFSYVVTAKNTYIITDGDETTVVESFFIDSDDALKEAGITLGAHDIYTERIADNGTSEINIRRAQIVTVHKDGISSYVITLGETVSDVMNSLGITLTDKDTTNCPLDAEIYDGMVLVVTSEPLRTEPLSIAAGLLQSPASVREKLLSTVQDLQAEQEALQAEPEAQMAAEPASPYVDDSDSYTPTAAAADSAADTGSASEANPDGGEGYITTSAGETLYYTQVFHCSATAYTTENAENKITATGTVARVGAIAVDPKLIPYGSKMYIVSEYGSWVYGYAVAEDCGGGIKGNKVDLFFDTYDECIQFGVKDAIVYVLPE